MKPTYQTKTGRPAGNCFAACVASILELPIEAMPDDNSPEWLDVWQRWLAKRNLHLVLLKAAKGSAPLGYTILTARVHPSDPDWLHAVVAVNGEPIWNPEPGYGERIGTLLEWVDWTLFVPIDPARPIVHPETSESRPHRSNAHGPDIFPDPID